MIDIDVKKLAYVAVIFLVTVTWLAAVFSPNKAAFWTETIGEVVIEEKLNGRPDSEE
jgi:hypothetical protein